MPEARRQLAAIMFTDIVGYTSLMGKDEQKALELLKKNKKIHKRLIAQFNGKLLKEIGDGILASFSSVSEAVYCAGAIQKDAKEEEISLRIGIHEGEVVFQDNDVFGDGVNIASRIEALATTGEILLSESAYKNIKNKEGIRAEFVKEETLKNVDEPVRIYSVSVDISETDGIQGYTSSATAASSTKTKPKSKNKALFASIGIILILALVYLFYNNQSDSEVSEKEIEKSIAVLPFEDMSELGDQEYFSDGISEEILNVLTKIPNLKVIGRTSSFSFKGKDVTIKDIGNALDVKTILEGSVRKMGNRVKITAQLIDVEGGFHIWSETYERDLNDIFKVQEEVAQMIAAKLMSELSPEDLKEVKVDEITNYQAYEYYLKGKYFHDIKFLGGLEKREDFDTSEEMFLKAIELDSSFALAHSELANLYNTGTVVFWSDSLFRALLLASQQKEIKIAYSLDANSSEINEIMGWVTLISRTPLSFDSAFRYFNRALELNPKNTDHFRALGWVYYEKGLYDEALYLYDQSIKLDPLNPITNNWKTGIYRANGSIKELQETALNNLKIEHNNISSLSNLTYSYVIKNELFKADSVLGLMYSLNPDYRGITTSENYLNAAKGKENLITNYNPVVYLLLGKTELAMKSLIDNKRPDRYYYLRYKNNSLYDPLRKDPGFIKLLEEEKNKYDLNKMKYKLKLPNFNL